MGDARIVGERLIKTVDSHDAEAAARLLGPDCEWLAPGANLRGREQGGGFIANFITAFPDIRHNLTKFVESEDAVVIEGVGSGTHNGVLHTPAGDVPPTGKQFHLPVAWIFTVRGGLITAAHIYYDQVDFLTQLGLMPAPASATA